MKARGCTFRKFTYYHKCETSHGELAAFNINLNIITGNRHCNIAIFSNNYTIIRVVCLHILQKVS